MDRGARQRRLRASPAGQLGALPAPPRPAPTRALERGGVRRGVGRARRAGGGVDPPGGGVRPLGVLRALLPATGRPARAHRDGRGRAPPGHRDHALRRRAPLLSGPRGLPARARGAQRGVAGGLLALSQAPRPARAGPHAHGPLRPRAAAGPCPGPRRRQRTRSHRLAPGRAAKLRQPAGHAHARPRPRRCAGGDHCGQRLARPLTAGGLRARPAVDQASDLVIPAQNR